MIRTTMLALAVAGLACAPASASDDPQVLRGLLAAQSTQAAPGCALATYRDGRLRQLVSDGLSNLDTGTPIDGGTVFYAASVSTQFTALAVVQLALQGKLDLDGDLRRWIPELPVFAATVTPRMLLQHRSGILDSLALVRLSAGPGQAAETSRERTLALVLAQTATNFAPGTSAWYSNGGYLLAAELVQRVSGRPFAEYVRQAILAPIGMHDSYVLDGEPPASPRRAHGYVDGADGFEIRDTYPRYGGSGGLMLSLDDLGRYEYDIEHGHKVWTPQVRALMEAPGELHDGSPAYTKDRAGGRIYALGLMVGQRDGHWIVEHGGGADAFRHMYSRVPAQKLAVAVFCNRADRNVAAMADAAIALLAPTGAHRAQLPATGLYRAQTLPARYLVSRIDRDSLSLAILPDGADAPAEVVQMRRDPDDDAFRGGGLQLTAPDADHLELGTPRARGLRARRISP
ncbi:serine hydrolase domain-containing protein [Luteimonas sp. SDU101]|uniref:serine hydrolase domain-containing protein n=1 Tax=Luteimonas sp. SDU101 TaxID=3422593 RepID=UPI003EBF0345